MIARLAKWPKRIADPIGLSLVLSAFMAGCTPGPQQVKGDSGFRVRHAPPGAKDMVEALLASGNVRLTHESCVRAGTASDDDTVGAYLSGFLAEMNRPNAGNHIVTQQPSMSDLAWTVRVLLRHADGEDVWSWGIEFAIRKRDGLVDVTSFRCVGAG